jgi:hypothetical protein
VIVVYFIKLLFQNLPLALRESTKLKSVQYDISVKTRTAVLRNKKQGRHHDSKTIRNMSNTNDN